jgi:hypothetical protein
MSRVSICLRICVRSSISNFMEGMLMCFLDDKCDFMCACIGMDVYGSLSMYIYIYIYIYI